MKIQLFSLFHFGQKSSFRTREKQAPFYFQMRLAMAGKDPEVAALLGLGDVVPSNHGSILLLSKCKDVSDKVVFRPTEACFRDLPVTYMGESYYRNPVSFVLQSASVEVDCHTEFSVHRIDNSYFKQVSGGLINVTSEMNITILSPKRDEDDIFSNWSFQSIGSIFGKDEYFNLHTSK